LATDQLGGDIVSKPVKLKVDSQPPRLQAHLRAKKGVLVLRIEDKQSGLKTGATRVSFGDGEHARGRARLHHHYARPGHYLVRVWAVDRVHNRLAQQFRVDAR
jgi:hypothetical protein